MVDEICIKLRKIIEENNMHLERSELVKSVATDSTVIETAEKVGLGLIEQNDTITKAIALLMEFSCK